ncbi:S-layer homology domain-containing protein [Neglecta sp. X4]|uniref:S-layer homology domain-containing protein n=1 Tax=unclassified Neglectibacter TaxID=2632164 RepID=UPI00136F70E0|nr:MULTISPECIES: S-layer homology domain-containing protein [unclassified Neglectibacter]NBI18070.1 S-layer homology domain-containing protein [Neglectibacter sp. 59]NBJ73747.1 S-layer homology domain-containing protein [Neglectibacter sp. X4]NCE81439.1 S-layer homology domain-containing protein [Neglectibacter sp. X58]
MNLKRCFMCMTVLILSLTMPFTTSNICSACEEGQYDTLSGILSSKDGLDFHLLSNDIVRIIVTNGNTGRTIYLESDKDLDKVVGCLNSFHYKSKIEATESVGYQYMLRIEFNESDNPPLSFQFTPNSILVDGEWLISDEPLLSGIVSLLPEDAIYLFEDVSSDDYWYNDIKDSVEHGILCGISDTHFAPQASLNRAMAVTVLHRLAGCPDEQGGLPFQDVERDAWYKKAVDWASGAEIVSGTGKMLFSPSSPVTREQIALMMYKYAQLKSCANANGNLVNYPDADQVSSWAKEAVEWVTRAGIIQCKLDISSQKAIILDPQGNVSRAEAAGMIRRFHSYLDSANGAV